MKDSIHIKYLITSERDYAWGLTVNSVGSQAIRPGEKYPPRNHPTRYLFSTERGRILEEYQLLYITDGNGRFTSSSQKEKIVKEGTMFLLFPGEWHNYHPDPNTGWVEYWIGFNGANIDSRLDNGFFTRQKPVFNVGLNENIVRLYKEAIREAAEQKTGYQQMLAGIVNHLLGYAYSLERESSFVDRKIIQHINKAKVIIAENIQTPVSPEELSRQLGLSYSWFRRIFKQYTGFSPARFIIEVQIRRSKELLTNTDMTSREIAFESGFDNPDYFCAVFKKKTGVTPSKYREFTQGKLNSTLMNEKDGNINI